MKADGWGREGAAGDKRRVSGVHCWLRCCCAAVLLLPLLMRVLKRHERAVGYLVCARVCVLEGWSCGGRLISRLRLRLAKSQFSSRIATFPIQTLRNRKEPRYVWTNKLNQ